MQFVTNYKKDIDFILIHDISNKSFALDAWICQSGRVLCKLAYSAETGSMSVMLGIRNRL